MRTREDPIYSRETSDKKLIRTYQRMFIVILVVVIAATAYIGIFRHSVAILNVTDDNRLVFSPESGDGMTIPITEIQSVEKCTNMELGECITADNGTGYTYGLWKNESLGQYRLFDYDSARNYIILKTNTLGTVVFNYMNTNNTDAFYEGLMDLIEEEDSV